MIHEQATTAEAVNCDKCHRVLKNPLSAERGFGPVCWRKVQAEQAAADSDHNQEA